MFGEGPFDLVVVPGALSNIAYGWEFKSWRNFYGTLASFARVLLFDKRGTGISDPVPGAPSIEERMDDVRAVMDVAGSQRAALMGSLDGAAMAALFAATYPERVAGLILNNPSFEVGGHSTTRGGVETSRARNVGRDLVGETRLTRDYIARVAPGRSGDAEFTRLLASYLRFSASPTTRVKVAEMGLAIDVREALSTIRAPTLVTHRDPPRPTDDERADDVFLRPVEASRYVAERIPGARFVELTPGDPPLWAIDQSEPLEVSREFLTGA